MFLTAWRKVESMLSGDESLPWLYGVAKNLVRNVNRSQRRSSRLSAKFMAQPHYPEPSSEMQIVRNEQDTELVGSPRICGGFFLVRSAELTLVG